MWRATNRHWRAYKALYRYITVVSILKIQVYTFYSLCTHFQRSLFRFRLADGGNQDGVAMSGAIIVVDDDPNPVQDNQGNQDSQGNRELCP